MKRIITAFIMLSLAITVATVSSVMLDQNIKSIISDIIDIRENIDNYNTNKIEMKKEMILNKWLKTEKTLKLISVQDKISPITEKLKELNFTDITNKNEIVKLLNEITILLEMFLSSEEIILNNIF